MGKMDGHNGDMVKQESVVEALWEFAANLQHRPCSGQVATIVGDSGVADKGTKASLAHIESALDKIMGIFGYTVTKII